jgi:glycosyltransferase involved in cell wall biosynthesis
MDLQRLPHILVDLTAAFGASAGIPQSARQMALLLARSPHWRTSALALSLHEQSRASLYGKARTRPQTLGDDAEYLASLVDAGQKRPSSFWADALYDMARRAGRSYPLIRFTPEIWGEIFWEHYFAPGFPPAFRNELKKMPFYRSPLTRPEATLAVRHGFPVARLDTRGCDVVIFQNPTPIRVSPGTVKIVRCHDLVPLRRFDTQPQAPHLIHDYRLALSQCVRDSHFACVSEATREALLDLYPAIRHRTSVIPNSIPISEWIDAQAPTREAPHPFFLAVGTIEPRKNYLRLLKGFRTYLESRPRIARLVLVGGRGWRNAEELREIEEAVEEGWLTWHERVEPHTLVELYREAHALIGASVDEGFGMPPLEAAVLGTPSVLADLRVFRTHLGDAAEYFDPYDTKSLAVALTRLTPARRSALASAARPRAERFSPDNEAAHWQELIRQVTRTPGIPRSAPVRMTGWVPREETSAIPLSIILGVEGWDERLPATLDRLVPQAQASGAEVIVGLREPCSAPERWPSVHFFTDPNGNVLTLRAQAASMARGEVIALTEDHGVVPPDWCEQLIREHRAHPEAAVIYGSVRHGGPYGITSWANFYATFGLQLPPMPFPPLRRTPPIVNVSIKRAYGPADGWKPGWFEFIGLPTLYDLGLCRAAGEMVVDHVQHHGLIGTYTAHYHNARVTTGLRGLVRGSPAWRNQLADSARVPVQNVVLDWSEIWRSDEPRGRLLLAFPSYALIALFHAAGEMAGLFFGPGDSAKHLD